MKAFKIEGWYRYNDEKDFETITIECDTPEEAIKSFKDWCSFSCYKIDIKEIV